MIKVVNVVKTAMVAGMFISSAVLANGYYLGGQIGFDRTKLDRAIKPDPANGGGKVGYNIDSSSSHFNGGVYGGYKMQLQDNMTLAFEADVFFLGSKSFDEKKSVAGNTGTMTITGKDKLDYMVGLSVLAGYVFDDMFEVYGRLGLSMASIQFKSATASKNSTTNSITKKKSVMPLGIVAGVGIQMSLASLHESLENVSARLDYRYIHYQNKNIDMPGTAIKTLDYKLSKHAIMFGVDYKF